MLTFNFIPTADSQILKYTVTAIRISTKLVGSQTCERDKLRKL